jgi:hypothetical protein
VVSARRRTCRVRDLDHGRSGRAQAAFADQTSAPVRRAPGAGVHILDNLMRPLAFSRMPGPPRPLRIRRMP